FEDARDLLAAAFGVDDLQPLAIQHQPDVAVLIEKMPRHRGGDLDGVLFGAFVAAARLRAALQIEHDPDIAGRVQLEVLDHEFAGARRAAPVNAVEAVAGNVVAHT